MKYRSILPSLLLFAAILMPASMVAAQQNQPAPVAAPYAESLPIEVALLYYKLLKQEPPYNDFVFSNRVLIDKTSGFGQSAVLEQHRRFLADLYKNMGPNTVIHARKKILLSNLSVVQRSLAWTGIGPDIPLIFELTATDRYGVFIRNAAQGLMLAPPYEFDSFNRLDALRQPGRPVILNAEMTLKPIIADKNDFKLGNASYVHVILADLVDLKITDLSGKELLVHKRFNNWQPQRGKIDTLFQPDLLPASPVE